MVLSVHSGLFHEFKETKPLLAYSGYVFATTRGMLRLTNNAHWLPYVLTSAGIGIFTLNAVYYIKPFERFHSFKHKKDLTFIPLVGTSSVGLLCRY